MILGHTSDQLPMEYQAMGPVCHFMAGVGLQTRGRRYVRYPRA